MFTDAYKSYCRKYPGVGYGSAFYEWALYDGKRPYGSFGNGSAMRISPIPDSFSDPDDIITYAAASAAATHNHLEGVKGAIVTAMACYMAYQGYTKTQIFEYMKSFYDPDIINEYLYKNVLITDFTTEELKKKYGPAICQYAVPAAAICFFYSDSFEDVITNCLSFDGDTDTIGAIAGSIAGAYYGIPDSAMAIIKEKIPENT